RVPVDSFRSAILEIHHRIGGKLRRVSDPRQFNGPGERRTSCGADAPRRRLLLVVLIRIDRHPKRNGARSDEPDPDGGTLRAADSWDPGKRYGVFGRQAVLRIWPGKRAYLSPFRRGYHRAYERAADACGRLPDPAQASTYDFLR